MAEITALLETPSFLVGRFRCPPADARWAQVNWIGSRHVLAFPRRAVVIERSRGRRVIANPNHVVLYDPDETYRRELLAPEGDDSLFIDVRPAAARELLVDGRPGVASFRRIESSVPAHLAFRLHALEIRLRSPRRPPDPVAVDELLGAVVAVLAAAPDDADRRPPSASGAERRRLVDRTRAFLSVAYADRLSLGDIGRQVGASPFHLARTFRAATGSTIHAYREQLRLREALRRLRDDDADLARVAVDVGFASHSHFDDRFRTAFGASPSGARAPRGDRNAHDFGSPEGRPDLAS